MAQQTKVPFRKWVPTWLGILSAYIIMVPIMMINGAYSGSSIDIASYLGVFSEDISMAYYAASAGMAVAYPLIVKTRPIITTKTMLLFGLIMQVLLSLICARTAFIEVIVICSFFIGFLKAFALLEVLFILMPVFSPDNIRSEFYSKFYPITLSLGQVSMVLTAQLAYSYQWQYMYYFIVALLLFAILFVLICFRYGRRPVRIPIHDIDWRSVLLVSVFFLSTIYVFTYGKTNDWFDSGGIFAGTILSAASLILFVRRQLLSTNPYLDLSVLENRNSRIGYLFMFVMMVISSSSSLVTSYVTSGLRLDSVHSNFLYLWLLPGFIVGALLCFYWFRHQLSFRGIVLIGFACFVGYLALLYFRIHPSGLYESLYLPMFLRGMGMLILFVSFGVYVVEGLPRPKMIYNAFFLIGVRSAMAPVVGSSLFTNWLYRLQQQNMVVLSENVDMQNYLAASRYTQALNNAVGQGNSLSDAGLLATNSLYTAVQTQSLMLSIKTILGYTILACIAILALSLLFPFHKKGPVKVVKTGIDMA